jgi:hypothetical protein
VVAHTEVHGDHQHLKQICSCLGLFAPVHAQGEQIRSTGHRVLPAALLLLEVGRVPQYHPHAMLQRNCDPQSLSTKEDHPQNIS